MSKSYYKKDDPTKVVSIVDDTQAAYYELSDGVMVKKDIFKKYYVERDNVPFINESFTPRKSNDHIDPATFFTSSSIVNEKDIQMLKNADPSKGIIDGAERTEILLNTSNKVKDAKPIINESARQSLKPQSIQNENIIQQVDETTLPIPDHTNVDVSSYKVYDNEDDAYNDFTNQSNNPRPVEQPKPQVQKPKIEVDQLYEDEKVAFGKEEADRRRNIRLKRTGQPASDIQVAEEKIQHQPQIDPTEMMFKTFKRNHEIKINVEFTDKIANPDFIKLMMENMDGDIVGFYKKSITDNIMNNFKIIEDEIEKQIKKEIFEREEDKKDDELINFDPKALIDKIQKLTNQIVDKSDEIIIDDELSDSDYLDEEVDKSIDGEESNDLISGGITSSGKQLYKYIDDKGRIRDVLPETAEKNGWIPYKEDE
jgi:hypothetical protein